MQADKLSEAEQLTFVNLLGSGLTSSDDELKMATAFLQPDKSLQVRRTTIESLAYVCVARRWVKLCWHNGPDSMRPCARRLVRRYCRDANGPSRLSKHSKRGR